MEGAPEQENFLPSAQCEPAPDELVVRPCRSLCRWVATPPSRDELFACQGCGSQWRPGVGWTPADADGTVPAAVRRAARRGAMPR